jgi:dTDP-4-dehydrorhamnose reductase
VGKGGIVVLGAAGMLGHKMFQTLRERFPGTVATAREDLKARPFDRVDLLQGSDVLPGVDVMDFGALLRLLQEMAPRTVVNCVGIIKQRDEARSAVPSITINALLPHKLAQWAGEWGGRVIHFSTDCVFSGRRGSYREDDPSDAEDLYGKSKYLGEVAADNALTLRTSIIGRELVEHRSLLDWFLGQRGKTVRGFRNVIYSGVTTNYISRLVAGLLERPAPLSGLYQVTSRPIAKYDLLCLLKDAYGLDVEILPDEAEVLDRSMVGEKFAGDTGIETPPWADLVAELVADPTPYGRWLSP